MALLLLQKDASGTNILFPGRRWLFLVVSPDLRYPHREAYLVPPPHLQCSLISVVFSLSIVQPQVCCCTVTPRGKYINVHLWMLEESLNFIGHKADSPSLLRVGPAAFSPTDITPPWRLGGRLPTCTFTLSSCSRRANTSVLKPGEFELPLQPHLTVSDTVSSNLGLYWFSV